MRIAPNLTANHVLKRIKFARWWRKEAKSINKYKYLFSDEKIFTVDGSLNKQNMSVNAVLRDEADEK